MVGRGYIYRYSTILVTTVFLLTSGCMKRERLDNASDQALSETPVPIAQPAAIAPPPPPPMAETATHKAVKKKSVVRNYQTRARTGAVRNAGLANKMNGALLRGNTGIPPYPVWPPEAPSSRVSLDRFIKTRTNLSLHDAGQKLKHSFEDAGYLEYSYYAAPGGFVLVTRIEKISPRGDQLPGTERYKLPSQRGSGSLTSFVRGLFLDAPPGFYRYIAVVVSDKPYQTSRKKLSSAKAETRLMSGSNNLSSTYKKVPFTSDHNVDALIYEFTKNTRTGNVQMIAPGRLTPKIHLAKTKLNKTIASNFKR